MLRLTQISCITAGFAVLAVAVWFRAWDLGRVPGVNGDEAWYGVQAERLADGRCSAWRTPTGNVINPFFMAPQVALHIFAAPSFTILRLPALASGLGALLVNYFLCRRALGGRVACLTTLIHAVLPINIAYSRFAWDASQSLLFTLPVVYAAVLAYQEPARRWRWTSIGVLCLAVAAIVHPTNLFVAPFLAIVGAAAWRERLVLAWQYPMARLFGFSLAVVAIAAVLSLSLPRISANVGQLENWSVFVRRFGDLFSGATVYEYLCGTRLVELGLVHADPLRVVLAWFALAAAGIVAFALFNAVRRGKSQIDAWLVTAWCATVLCFFVIAGPGAILPHYERYAICLVAPTVVVVARGFHWWMQPTTRFSLATAPLLLAVAGGMLAAFKSQYFDEFNERGGSSHLTFRTARIEPKQHAIEVMFRDRDASVPLLVQTSEWWLYWPLQYLAYGCDDVKVELRSSDDPRPLDQQAFSDIEAWIVEFIDSDAGWNAYRAFAALGPKRDQFADKRIIHDSAGRNLLLLIRLPAKR